jgi:hypothetical protein
MDRRSFLQLLASAATAVAVPATPRAPAPARRVLLQQSPLAGFQYHHGESLWPLLRAGAALVLVREPGNRHDPKAVALHFRHRRIGYLPQLENTAVSQLMDRGEKLSAHIIALARDPDPWKRMRVAVELEV